jgi:hypothetical protein
MKMTAVIEVEFELIDGQPENAARAALQRGLIRITGYSRTGRFLDNRTPYK